MKKQKKYYFMYVMVVVVFCISVGYAAISRTLNITGNSEVKQNTWDVHFENIKITSGSVEAISAPVIDENSKLAVSFNVMLNLPGDYYEFTVDVKNSGTIDAMIDFIEKTPELTTEQAKYLNYMIEYQNGEQISSKQLVSKNSFVRIKVRVEYREDVLEADMPTTNQTLNLGFTLSYVQADFSTAISVKDNGIFEITANGAVDDIGTIVTIGTEKFYVYGTDGENVKLLSMYNLNVGADYNYLTGERNVYGYEANGMQNENMLGWTDSSAIYKGVSPFSTSYYKGVKFSDYNGSIVEGYINNYKSKLEKKFGINIVEARVITNDELTAKDIGCVEDDRTCINAPSFIYSTTYWTGTEYDPEGMWIIKSDGIFGTHRCYTDTDFGVRPVILISKNDIVVKVKPVANGDINEIGTVVTIGDQQFYTIGTEGDNVKLFAKYNLYVGNQYDDSNGLVLLANPTGKQSEVARGIFSGYSVDNPIIGVTAFSKTNSTYIGSIVEGYVNNYKSILENEYGVDIVEARLITKEELIDDKIGCSDTEWSCEKTLKFIYSTSYWTSSSKGTMAVWRVYSSGSFCDVYYNVDDKIGVRPVIVLKQSDILVKKMMEFTIDGVTYQAEEGMTWEDWCNSDYNARGYYIEDGFVISSVGLIVNNVSATDLISSNGIYELNGGDSGESE